MREYSIDKERYLELKHFCLQYDSWGKPLILLRASRIEKEPASNDICDATGDLAVKSAENEQKRRLLISLAHETDPLLAKYILLAVTKGYTYTYLRNVCDIPCCRNIYYRCYRKFFWLLDKARS